ncbi:YhhN family protein [compost metagenome]
MLSDTLLAINRFVSPLPMAQVWVLSTYYAAQVLIVMGILRSASSVGTEGAARGPGATAGPRLLTR